jgi:hypothetical protein
MLYRDRGRFLHLLVNRSLVRARLFRFGRALGRVLKKLSWYGLGYDAMFWSGLKIWEEGGFRLLVCRGVGS